MRRPPDDTNPQDAGAARSGPTTTELGRAGEDRALKLLEAEGLTLLTRNYRCRAGEIDLVMLDAEAGVLVMVEVRTRTRRDYGSAAATIGRAKRRRCSLAARHLLLRHRELNRLRARFDVVTIDPPALAGEEPRLEWIRGAFDAC